MKLFKDFFSGKRVLITGITGFKGSWLALWLLKMDAKVGGFADAIPTTPSLFDVTGLESEIEMYWGDIRSLTDIASSINDFEPDLIFHLAAQSLVHVSIQNPKETFEVNCGGTINLLESVKNQKSVKSTVCITSDKCYQNVEWVWGYRENDRLGGNDPYSASKAAAEIAIHSYIRTFFQTDSQGIASARAGNVIGGADWAPYRIVPDCAKAWAAGQQVVIKNPASTRPWQHVLEPLSGYLTLGMRLFEQTEKYHGHAFNFGPPSNQDFSVEQLINSLSKFWKNPGSIMPQKKRQQDAVEAKLLKLNCDKALAYLDWKATLKFEETTKLTAEWYKEYYAKRDNMQKFTLNQIALYEKTAAERQSFEGVRDA